MIPKRRAIHRVAGSVAFSSRSTSQSNGVGYERTWRFARFLCNLLIVFRPFAGRGTFAPVAVPAAPGFSFSFRFRVDCRECFELRPQRCTGERHYCAPPGRYCNVTDTASKGRGSRVRLRELTNIEAGRDRHFGGLTQLGGMPPESLARLLMWKLANEQPQRCC